MGGLQLMILALTLGAVYLSESRNLNGEIYTPHIIGGEPADIKDFKYQVSLRKNGESNFGHVCGASILDSKHVLTAAHCITRPIPKLYYIVTNTSTLEGGVKYFVDKYMIHPKYTSDATGTHNDVAVLRVDKPFVFDGSTNSKPIPLVGENKEPVPDVALVIAGWGKFGNAGNENISKQLRKVSLKAVTRADCQKCYDSNAAYKGIRITPGHICAGGNSKDASVGDSGGALVDTKLSAQVAVVSFGDESSVCPGIYTNLAHKEIRDFIQAALKLNIS